MKNDLTERLRGYYIAYTAVFVVLILVLAFLEQHGMPPRWIGYAFLIFTILMYAVIGIVSRTSDVSEFYVAGRRVPARAGLAGATVGMGPAGELAPGSGMAARARGLAVLGVRRALPVPSGRVRVSGAPPRRARAGSARPGLPRTAPS